MRSLGRYFTFNVGTMSYHVLVTRGPYRYLMHPGYLGQILSVTGLIYYLGLRDGVAWSVLGIYVIHQLARRIQQEEQALHERFGNDWVRYKNQRWRLIPGLF